jgi:molybdenum cofactor guanylyltransferase
MIFGLLLAGGLSSRFGSEKAVHPLGGAPMMDRPLAALDAVSDRLAISARPGSAVRREAVRRRQVCLTDARGAPSGPLAGIQAGLAWAATLGADWLVTAPCDAPTVTPTLLRALKAAVLLGAPAAMARSPRGVEPLIAFWPTAAARPLVDAALARGDHPPVRRLLARLEAIEVAGHDGRNINTREEFAALVSEGLT